jgi:hypothetical protein
LSFALDECGFHLKGNRWVKKMDEKAAKRVWLRARHSLLQAMLMLVEINSKVQLDKMSAKDSQEFRDAMQMGQKASEAMGQTISAALGDDELYAQMTASSDRMREEIERQISIINPLLSRQRS